MRFGICCSALDAAYAKEAGFDYVELPGYSMKDTEPPWADLPVEAVNLFFGPDVRLCGPNATLLEGYFEEFFEVAALAGVKVVAVGGSGARSSRGEVTVLEAEACFVKAVAEASQVAKRYGIEMAPEALNHFESDVFNDTSRLALAFRDVGVGYTLDTYHVLVENKSRQIYWVNEIPFKPTHVHVAGLARDLDSLKDEALIGAASRLKDLGYDGRASFEGKAEVTEYSDALRSLRELFCF